jgi:photosystem II stability/assembly factor-like uncharacterized protein
MKSTRSIHHLLVSAVTAAFALALAPSANAQRIFENKDEQKLRQEAFWSTHRDPQGRVRPDLWRLGIDQYLTIRASRPWWMLPPASNWFQIGPQPLRIDNDQIYQGEGPDSGEVVDIAIDPSGDSDNTIYIATNDGGIWKTTDGGMTWKVMTDTGCPDAMTNCPSLSMGAVTLAPQDSSMVFAGTGNPFDGGGLFTKGVGIYRSKDGGATWTVLNPGGIFTNVSINRIVAGVYYSASITKVAILVATNMGLFRSIDSGDHFGNNSPNFDNGLPILAGYITDLKVDTPVRQQALAPVYAAVHGKGIYKSYNGGVTFPVNLFDNPGAPGAGTYSFVSFAIAWQTNKQRVYASVEKSDGTYLGLYRSDDGGRNWTRKAAADAPGAADNGCQCGYDQTVGVDPQDWDRVYIGFQELWMSADGADTFGAKAVTDHKVHWDHHAIYFSPQSHWGAAPTRVWVGQDGGIASSTDGGTSWDNLNETIATNLYKHIDIGRNSTDNIAYTYGGTQDTGTNEHQPGFMNNDWHLAIDGDGSGVGVDPFTATTAYGIDNGTYIYTVDGGDTWVNFFNPPPPPPIPSVWRYAIDPNNGKNVFAVTSTNSGFAPGPDLYRSTDEGVTYTKIATLPSPVQSITNTPIDSKLLWLGLSNGSLQRCGDAFGGNPGCVAIADPSGTGNPVGGISIVLTDPTDASRDRVIAVYEGFSGAMNPSKHVFYTQDSGATWKDISNTLPDLPTHSIYGSAAVSNDAGVMFTTNLGTDWSPLGSNLPTVDSTQLAGGQCPSVLRLGTYGRSVYELNQDEVGFYDDGPVNGLLDALPISGGAWASNSFRAPGSAMGGVTFWVWVPHEQIPAFVTWSVTYKPHEGFCQTGNAHLEPEFLFTNPFGLDVYKAHFSIDPPLPVTIGATYFLNLEGFLTNVAGPGFWDVNLGAGCLGSGMDLDDKGANCPSYAFTMTGSAPPEAFKVTTAP